MKTRADFQRRFLAYCDVRGVDPNEPFKSREFIEWMNERWAEWRAANKRKPDSFATPADHAAFDEWLPVRVAELRASGPAAHAEDGVEV